MGLYKVLLGSAEGNYNSTPYEGLYPPLKPTHEP